MVVESMICNSEHPNCIYLIAAEKDEKDTTLCSIVYKFNLKNGSKKVMKKYKRHVHLMDLSRDGKYLVVAGDRRFDIFSLGKSGERTG